MHQSTDTDRRRRAREQWIDDVLAPKVIDALRTLLSGAEGATGEELSGDVADTAYDLAWEMRAMRSRGDIEAKLWDLLDMEPYLSDAESCRLFDVVVEELLALAGMPAGWAVIA